ncbi:L,D-transpeptidase [Streptomyces beijiangensis]|uniref:L,D-transpeptidase family protein n=1 Tax=Streptomyces beijiangensis TaxID=163361 RepID=A0A939FAR9_9ACTN|nr:Ig-like domain-containing protein [Streptomyces beijiangensis]MBO0513615.1 L,D-transpeptidase family protein [Streptomyces beijiangensis]
MKNIRKSAALGTAICALALTACSGHSSGSGSGSDSGNKNPAKAATVTAPKITVNLTGQQAPAGARVKVTLAEGKLNEVTVTGDKAGSLAGELSPDGRTWTSVRGAAPGTGYTVRATTADGGTARAAFATAAAGRVNKVTMSPVKDTAVGVAQPLSIVFDNPVKNKAAVERQLKVTTSDNTEGSWGWIQDYSGRDRVDWRPKEYWKPGTRVALKADLNGTDSGGGFFVRDYSTRFTIGRDQLTKVNLDTKQLSFYQDGRRVKQIPVSGGTPGGDKRSWRGTAVVIAREGTINMRSETVGLGHTYNKMVNDSMRLTWSGMYAHAAPWNARYFGNTNHSSGCIGMSDANAGYLFGITQVGDPFEITGAETKGTVALGNGYGEWNLSWADWQAKSAARSGSPDAT